MAGRKAVTPGHVVESGAASTDKSMTALDGLQELEGTYQFDMAPIAVQEKPEASQNEPRASTDDTDEPGPDTNTPQGSEAIEDESEPLILVVLKKGASFWHSGRIYKNGEANAVDEKTAEKLVRSGYFERG